MITEAGLSIVQSSDKVQRTDVTNGNRPTSQDNELNQAGQGSSIGPAVVANFSAAALESSRAVMQTTQTADKNPTASADRAEQSEPPPPEPPAEQMIDTYA